MKKTNILHLINLSKTKFTMEDLDYYTVMESKIKYYAKKYDPYDKLNPAKVVSSIPKELFDKPKPVKRKLIAVIDTMIAFLF